MNEIVFLGLFAATAIYVGLPFLKNQSQNITATEVPGKLYELESDKENVISTLKEMEFDYQMGKISTTDFDDLNQNYRRKAAQIIQSIEEMKNHTSDNDIEAEIRRYRQTPNRRFCINCGTARQQEDKFCSNCGASL
ncbi:MAG: zinc ribbon domain-containing protein [Calditrichaeota bacterium]|nr:zinc ribbon domain-containing protein [Calditrichota bacterium]